MYQADDPNSGGGLNDGLSQKRRTSADNRDFTIRIMRCVYRAYKYNVLDSSMYKQFNY